MSFIGLSYGIFLFSVSLFRFHYVDQADLRLRSACLCLLRYRIKGIGYHTQPVHPFLLFKKTHNFRTCQGLKAHRCQEGQRQQIQGIETELHKRYCFSSCPCTAADRSSEELGLGIFISNKNHFKEWHTKCTSK